MSSVAPATRPARALPAHWLRWVPVLVGLLALYAPTFWELSNTLWQNEEHAHGPIVLAMTLWFFWQNRAYLAATDNAGQLALGALLLALGLLLYVLGSSQDIWLFEVGSLVPVLIGVLIATLGWASAKKFWFALLFIVFMVPLPGFLVENLTGPLKQAISYLAENLLYWAGYPIARDGVVLSVGQYRLMVADACSGLHSIFSLAAMGLLYIYLMRYQSWVRNAILLASIVPIAFLANLLRVLTLVLVTYHFGDAAGQGIVHGFAGISLFIVALLMLFVLDWVVGKLMPNRRRQS